MAKPHYMLEKPSRPSRSRTVLNQGLIPALINVSGAAETVLERMAVVARRSPIMALGIAGGAGALLSVLLPRSRDRERPTHHH